METDDGRHSSLAVARAAARVLAEGRAAALATVVEGAGRVGSKLLVGESGDALAGTTGDASLDAAVAAHAPVFLASRAEAVTLKAGEFASGLEDPAAATRVLFERVEPEPHLVVCGAGHVGAGLARLASATGYRVTLIDDRADFLSRPRFPEERIELVVADEWAAPVRRAIGTGRGVYAAVVTRGHNEDEECMKAVLMARPDYVGMIGSRRRTNIVLARLREAGFSEEDLRAVHAPVGLDLGAVTPEEVALAILAEIVAFRRGGTGAPLSAFRRE
ncbi:MAG TPA: XdhC/CoxI family protein [Pyrinomonadaceae bacterium]|jgi:xanthine dehydrogenase accessory factor|nr:XdhC/CoxI family protein [Pyrinomonadaceae bacterium]